MILPLTVTRPVRVPSFSRARLQGANSEAAVIRNEPGTAADERASRSASSDFSEEGRKRRGEEARLLNLIASGRLRSSEEPDVAEFDSQTTVNQLRREAGQSPSRVLAGATAHLSHAAGIHLGGF